MKFTLKVKAVSVLAIAALGALQAAHAQVDSTGITALRGTPRLEAAAPTVNQEGGTCGFLSFSAFNTVAKNTPCNGSNMYVPGTALSRLGTVLCPAGYVVMGWGPKFSQSVHTGGSSSTGSGDSYTVYRDSYHTCFKNS